MELFIALFKTRTPFILAVLTILATPPLLASDETSLMDGKTRTLPYLLIPSENDPIFAISKQSEAFARYALPKLKLLKHENSRNESIANAFRPLYKSIENANTGPLFSDVPMDVLNWTRLAQVIVDTGSMYKSSLFTESQENDLAKRTQRQEAINVIAREFENHYEDQDNDAPPTIKLSRASYLVMDAFKSYMLEVDPEVTSLFFLGTFASLEHWDHGLFGLVIDNDPDGILLPDVIEEEESPTAHENPDDKDLEMVAENPEPLTTTFLEAPSASLAVVRDRVPEEANGHKKNSPLDDHEVLSTQPAEFPEAPSSALVLTGKTLVAGAVVIVALAHFFPPLGVIAGLGWGFAVLATR